jgi:GDP-4-dehydro-6-deoxy-D-mannose reductase
LKRVLIFGNAGFTGRYMTRYLEKMPDITLFGADRIKSGLIDEVQTDLTDFESVNQLITHVHPDFILNLSGLNQANDPAQLYKANVIPVINAIQSLNNNEFFDTKFLTISSAAVYGNAINNPIAEETLVKPVNFYGASKAAMEQLLTVIIRDNTCKILVARTFNLIGPGLLDTLSIPSFIKQLIKIQRKEITPVLKVGNLSPKRDYIDIQDAVRAYWKIASEGKPGEIYNVGSGRSLSMEEILDMIIQKIGIEVTIETDKSRVRKNEIMNSQADIRKIKELEWSPEIDFRQSLQDMIDYYQQGN